MRPEGAWRPWRAVRALRVSGSRDFPRAVHSFPDPARARSPRARGLRTRCGHRGGGAGGPVIDPRTAQRPRVRSWGRAPGRGEGGGPGKTPERGGRRRGGGRRPREAALRAPRGAGRVAGTWRVGPAGLSRTSVGLASEKSGLAGSLAALG